jgi:hypothetical protein
VRDCGSGRRAGQWEECSYVFEDFTSPALSAPQRGLTSAPCLAGEQDIRQQGARDALVDQHAGRGALWV